MKNLIKVTVLALALVFLNSCEKETASSTGNVIFWISQPMNTVNCTIDGQTNVITSYYESGINECQQSGCAYFEVPIGTYSFTAKENGVFGYSWSGSITVKGGECFQQYLYY